MTARIPLTSEAEVARRDTLAAKVDERLGRRPAAPPDFALEADAMAAIEVAFRESSCYDCYDRGYHFRASVAVLNELKRAGLTIMRAS